MRATHTPWIILSLLAVTACSPSTRLVTDDTAQDENRLIATDEIPHFQCPGRTKQPISQAELDVILASMALEASSDNDAQKRILAGLPAALAKTEIKYAIEPTQEQALRAIHHFVFEGRIQERIHARVFDYFLKRVDVRTLSDQQLDQELARITSASMNEAHGFIQSLADSNLDMIAFAEAIRFTVNTKLESGGNPFPHDIRSQLSSILIHCGAP